MVTIYLQIYLEDRQFDLFSIRKILGVYVYVEECEFKFNQWYLLTNYL